MPKQGKEKAVREFHGRVGTPEYNSWRGMVERCESPNHHQYADYGGRGITVYDRWRKSFMAFYEDMGSRPKGYTIERKDNSKGYEPGNCEWVSRSANCRNKRNNHLLTCDGVTKPLCEWCEETGLNYVTILSRINRSGWSVKKALTTPVAGVRR